MRDLQALNGIRLKTDCQYSKQLQRQCLFVNASDNAKCPAQIILSQVLKQYTQPDRNIGSFLEEHCLPCSSVYKSENKESTKNEPNHVRAFRKSVNIVPSESQNPEKGSNMVWHPTGWHDDPSLTPVHGESVPDTGVRVTVSEEYMPLLLGDVLILDSRSRNKYGTSLAENDNAILRNEETT
jgi:hypothetical protein